MTVLIIGLGSIAKKHVSALKKIDKTTQIYALRSGHPSEQVDNIENIYFYKDIRTVNPDFCIISNPTGAHYDTIKRLLEYDIPLFIEKPLFSSVGVNEKQLVTTITNSGIPNYVACNLRFLDSLRVLKESIEDERVNEVNVYCGSYLPDWRPSVDLKNTYSPNKEMGGGVHIDLIHELDYTYWLFGSPKQTNRNFRSSSSLDITSYDYANYTWQYEDFTASIILNYYRKKAKRTIEVLTAENIYSVDLLTNTVYRDNLIIYSSEQRIVDTYESQLNFFIDTILLGKGSFNHAEEAYKVLELCIN